MSLTVDGATRTFTRRGRPPVPALRQVDLSVGVGELVVLVGPSGSGKSTLLRAVAGLESLDAGRVLVDGTDVTTAGPGERAVALVFQDLALFPHLTVGENIGFGARGRGARAAEVRTAVAEAAELLGIADLVDRRPGELSGGERQRVALARALLRDPRLFLLDEPFSSVDAELRVRLREEVKDLQRRTGVAMVHVTHDRTEAMALADRVVVLRGGAVEQVGTPDDVWHRPSTLSVARLMDDVPLAVITAAAVGQTGDHVLAVRAGDLRLHPAGSGRLDVRVDDVVLDGGTAVVRCSSPVGPVHVRARWEDRPRAGRAYGVDWEARHEHRFAADGTRMS